MLCIIQHDNDDPNMHCYYQSVKYQCIHFAIIIKIMIVKQFWKWLLRLCLHFFSVSLSLCMWRHWIHIAKAVKFSMPNNKCVSSFHFMPFTLLWCDDKMNWYWKSSNDIIPHAWYTPLNWLWYPHIYCKNEVCYNIQTYTHKSMRLWWI